MGVFVRHYLLVILFALSLAACAPSPEQAATMTVALWTATPTQTSTPTSTTTPIPTLTASPTPSPTPFGGGRGLLKAYCSKSGETERSNIPFDYDLVSGSLVAEPPSPLIQAAKNLPELADLGAIFPVYSPNEKLAAIADQGRLFIASADGRTVREITGLPNMDIAFNSQAWSPASDQIVFSAGSSPSDLEIYILDVASGSVRRITNDNRQDAFPVFSPDGSNIAFASQLIGPGSGDSSNGLYVTNVDSPNDDPSLSYPVVRGIIIDPQWSPDGSRLAMALADPQSGAYEIYSVKPDGADLTPLTDFGLSASSPLWSPDSAYLSFSLYDFASRASYVMDANDSNARPISIQGHDCVVGWLP